MVDRAWRVPLEELDFSEEELVHTYQGRPFSGVAVTNDGREHVEFWEGRRDGWTRVWSADGILLLEEEMWCDTLHGRCRRWGPAGQLLMDATYEYGIRVCAKRWGEGGALVEDFELTASHPTYKTLLLSRGAYGSRFEISRARRGRSGRG